MTTAYLRRFRLEPLEDRLLLASLTGTLFDDRDGNGTRSANEPALAGRVVFLDADRDGTLDASEEKTTTAADGSYRFTDLAPGRYLVAQLSPAGWRATAPAVAAALPSVPDGGKLIGMERFRADPRFAGIDGRGSSVVVIDTGLAPHPFFPWGAVAAQYDFVNNDAVADDGHGHGTHVASVIASRDAAFPGIAPGVRLVGLKVLDAKGDGDFGGIERALRWVIEHHDEYDVTAVNLSFGDAGAYDSPRSLHGIGDELAELARLNVLLVASAGNGYGPDESFGLSYPAIDPNALPVGAVWDANHSGPWVWEGGARDNTTGPDRIVSFSQRLGGVGELFAPGTRLVGAAPGGGTTEQTGTSVAAAVVTGAAALAQQLARERLGRPLSVGELRSLMQQTGAIIRDGDDEDDNVRNTDATFRRLDVMALAEAILAKGTVSPGKTAASRDVSLGEGQTVSADLGSFADGRVGGVAFADTDGDGWRDPNETVVSARLVFADRDGDGHQDAGEPATRSDAQGRFLFTGLGPGTVRIRQEVPAGQRQTTAVPAVNVTSGLSRLDLALGSRPDRVSSAPTLSGDGPTTTTNEDDPAPAGFTVASALAGTFADADGSPRGLAVVETTGGGWGRWQYSLDDGRSWSDVGATSATQALLLRGQDRLRFLPARDGTGTATVRYHAWDQTAGTWGRRVDLTAAGAKGGGGAFSTAAATARVAVVPVNDAPVLTAPGELTKVTAGTPSSGDRVSDVLAGTILDADAGALAGMAIVGVTGQGKWQFSRDGGATWQDLVAPSASRARLLGPSDRLRFVPSTNKKATATITYRAWDLTSGAAGGVVALSSAGVGGTTAFSRYSTTATLLIEPAASD